MTGRRVPLLTGAALLALPMLSGCVAAAIPALAATGVLGTQMRGDENDRAAGQNRVAIDTTPTATEGAPEAAPPVYSRNYTLPDGTRMEVTAGAPGTAAPSTVAAPASPGETAAPPAAALLDTVTLADGSKARIIGGSLPPPTGGVPAPSVAISPAAQTASGYDPFASFAARQGALPVGSGDRRSAILENPGTLAPATRECSIHSAAVLIDLDPADGTLDPATAMSADPRLAGALAGLRGDGVAIGWLTANTADRAGAVRRALVASGLDPAGKDELALLRYPDERKQTRREDFAKEFCLVAIAGDDRTDFDELFQYLKDPSLATPLEPLIGNGWFLIPQPLTQG